MDFVFKLNDLKILFIFKIGILCICVNFELIFSLMFRFEC